MKGSFFTVWYRRIVAKSHQLSLQGEAHLKSNQVKLKSEQIKGGFSQSKEGTVCLVEVMDKPYHALLHLCQTARRPAPLYHCWGSHNGGQIALTPSKAFLKWWIMFRVYGLG